MKHLKTYEGLFDLFSKKKNQKDICKKWGITNYTPNNDGSIDVDGNVNLETRGLKELPLKFGKVTGYFYCHSNQLTTLEGGPSEVGGYFDCGNNQLTTLEGAPREVGGDFNCYNNQLTTLEGAPREVVGSFNCSYNQLTTLEGGPRSVGGDFNCYNNQLTTLEGSPRSVGGYFSCYNNPIHSVYILFPDHKSFMDSLDYNYLRGSDIVKFRFKEACEEAGIKVPKSINGYKYIYIQI